MLPNALKGEWQSKGRRCGAKEGKEKREKYICEDTQIEGEEKEREKKKRDCKMFVSRRRVVRLGRPTFEVAFFFF